MPHLLSNNLCLAKQNPRLRNGGLGHTIQITQISADLRRVHPNQTTCSLYQPEHLPHQRLSMRVPFLPSITTTYHPLIPAHPQCHEHSAPRPPIQFRSMFSYLCGPRQSRQLLLALQTWGCCSPVTLAMQAATYGIMHLASSSHGRSAMQTSRSSTLLTTSAMSGATNPVIWNPDFEPLASRMLCPRAPSLWKSCCLHLSPPLHTVAPNAHASQQARAGLTSCSRCGGRQISARQS